MLQCYVRDVKMSVHLHFKLSIYCLCQDELGLLSLLVIREGDRDLARQRVPVWE